MTTIFASHDPQSGQIVHEYPVAGDAEVGLAHLRAREAFTWWSALAPHQRAKRLLQWKKLIVARIDEVVQLIVAEGGKPESDARFECALAIEHLNWAAKNAGKVLAPESRSSSLMMSHMSARVEHVPFGVIGVIGPWNYPIFTPMGSVAYAMAAGNAVIFKPSEYTPGVGVWLAETWNEVCPDQPVLQAITGQGETGAALCRVGVDKIAFTGSTRTAKKVAALCAEKLIPLVAECGGKDAFIVSDDADVKAAAENTLWAAMSNAGQTCIGAERVYVHEKVADEFIRIITAQAGLLSAGVHYGAMTMPSQIDVITKHVEDALAAGGTPLVGGREAIQAPYVQPIIIAEVPENNSAVQEETFGPVLIINRVKSDEEAIEKANATSYGLGASVWSKRKGKKIAQKLRTGMISINSVLGFAGVSSVPFGGVGDSGYGRIHGPEGLKEFTFARSIAAPRFRSPLQLTSFRRGPKTDALIARLIRLLHG